MPRSSGIRNSRGRGLPSDGQADTEPISTWPKPIAPSIPIARPFLSKPAASPSGFSSGMPASVVCRRGSPTRSARRATRRGIVERPESSETRSVSSCARSGSSRNSSGRTASSYKGMRQGYAMLRGVVPEPQHREPPFVSGAIFVVAMAAVMWVAEVADQLADGRLDRYGIEPRDVDGLDGIVFAPFLHAGWDHLIGNTIPFLLLGLAVAVGGLARVATVTVIVALVGGLGTWLVAPANTIHIG